MIKFTVEDEKEHYSEDEGDVKKGQERKKKNKKKKKQKKGVARILKEMQIIGQKDE